MLLHQFTNHRNSMGSVYAVVKYLEGYDYTAAEMEELGAVMIADGYPIRKWESMSDEELYKLVQKTRINQVPDYLETKLNNAIL